MKKLRVVAIILALLSLPILATGQTNPPIVQWQAVITTINNIQAQLNTLSAQVANTNGGKSLTFGGTTIPTNATPPANGATLCNNGNTLGGCAYIALPFCQAIVTTSVTALPNCTNVSVDMRATSTLILPAAVDGQALNYVVYQNPSFGGGFTPTFAAYGNAVCTASATPLPCCTGNTTGTCTTYTLNPPSSFPRQY